MRIRSARVRACNERYAHIPSTAPEEEAFRARPTHLIDGVLMQAFAYALALRVTPDAKKHAPIVLVRLRAVMFVLRCCEEVLEL